jgi:hypothetical protein
MTIANLQNLIKSPDWEDYLDHIGELQEEILRQMMQLNISQHEEFIVLNAKLQVLDQITHYLEIDVVDNQTNEQENLERLVVVEKKYVGRIKSLIKKLIRSDKN